MIVLETELEISERLFVDNRSECRNFNQEDWHVCRKNKCSYVGFKHQCSGKIFTQKNESTNFLKK